MGNRKALIISAVLNAITEKRLVPQAAGCIMVFDLTAL
jgi:hypothetical protein